MKYFFVVIFQTFFVFDEICGEVTHGTFVSKFHSKAWITDKKTKDWTKELKPLFTLWQDIKEPQIEEALNSLIIINVEFHVNQLGQSLSVDDRTTIFSDTQDILSKQPEVHNLCNSIGSQLRMGSTVKQSIESESKYMNWCDKKIENSHLTKVTKNLNDMKKIHKHLLSLIKIEFSKIKPTKAAFKKEIEEFLGTCIKTETFRNTQSHVIYMSLEGKLNHIKKIQTELWQTLKIIESILNEYQKQRKIWVNFLMALRDTIEPCTLHSYL
ncbi:uncharacterized protein LOC116345340 [Contarinia nasturtii]|uniref:uncharacterized protein LOC116345340 n=1 Tax=Contarinia nasturtii TaxID=265458 RepID=UPI0012D45F4F|nr:uncharacterized protein LOC116345340 [Contarinia nasturtii]